MYDTSAGCSDRLLQFALRFGIHRHEINSDETCTAMGKQIVDVPVSSVSPSDVTTNACSQGTWPMVVGDVADSLTGA